MQYYFVPFEILNILPFLICYDQVEVLQKLILINTTLGNHIVAVEYSVLSVLAVDKHTAFEVVIVDMVIDLAVFVGTALPAAQHAYEQFTCDLLTKLAGAHMSVQFRNAQRDVLLYHFRRNHKTLLLFC